MKDRLAELSDEDLLAAYADAEAVRKRRERAFHLLVDRYERRVYAICYRYFGDHADAEDATQDTFLLLARRAGQFRGDSRLSTWIYRVATNACHDLARKEARRPRTPVADVEAATDAPSDDGVTPDEAAAAGELADRVQTALLELDEVTRGLVIACAIEGQPYAEVASAFDLPVGTVKSRVHRARAKLAQLLAPAGNRDGPDDVPQSTPPTHPPTTP